MEITDIPGSIDLFLGSLTVNGLSKNTVRAYQSDLKGWLTEFPSKGPTTYTDPATGETDTRPPVWTRAEVEASAAGHLTRGRSEWSASTTNRKLAALRKFGRWLGFTDFLAEYKPPKPARGIAHPLPEGIQGILDMIEEARKPEHKALVTLIGLLGLRCGEALKVRPSDIDEDSMTMRVRGKGDKDRIVPVHDRAYEALLPRLVQCWGDDGLLVPMHDRTARRAWTGIARRAGITKPSSTHDGRMTFGTVAYNNSGGDIRAVQELLGHSSVNTTENYTEVNMDKMRDAAGFF